MSSYNVVSDTTASKSFARNRWPRLVCFCKRFSLLDSAAFAKRLGVWRDGGKSNLAVVIGSADGLGKAVSARADLRLAFGAMTWPHQLVRIMLAEQLYRAVTILSGHPYHRE